MYLLRHPREPIVRSLSLVVCVLVLMNFAAAAQTVRVTAWSMEAKNGPGSGTGLESTVAALEKLKPDVILLQDVADWQMCNQLAEALKPASYSVIVCSAFRSVDGQKRPQVAILSKHKAYLSWAQNWRNQGGELTPSGFVFAGIQIGQRRLAFFSLQPGPNGSVNQWLQGIGGIKSWVNNRVEGLIAACPWSADVTDRAVLQSLEEAGFTNPFLNQFSDMRGAGPVTASLIANVTAPQGMVMDHWPATCDIGLDVPPAGTVITALRGRVVPPEPAQTMETRSVAEKGELTASRASPVDSSANSWQSRMWWLIPAFGLVTIVSALRGLTASRKRLVDSRAPALLPLHTQQALIAPASSTGSTAARDTSTTGEALIKITAHQDADSAEDWKRRALIAERQAREATELVQRGLLPQLIQWLKGKFVKKLIDDRARNIEAQEEATRKTLHVDERLARVEKQLQQRHRAYQDRIDVLTRELRAARSENCDIIRAQINQVKAEMEASRARLLAEAGDDFPN